MTNIWYKVRIEPLSPPSKMKYYCESKHFFVDSFQGSYPREKALEMIKEICHYDLLKSYDGEMNVRSLQNFLQSQGYKTDIEDTTIEEVSNTALCLYFEQIYRIASIEPASSCEACRLGEQGQLAHMQEGGCLYRSSEEN